MAAGTWESYHAITALMYRYAECIDAADFAGIADVFADAVMTNEGTADEIRGGAAIARLYERTNRVHDDGTLRTRHLTGNVFVDIDEAANTATARSSFVVFQQTATLPLQPIVTGRYRDRFERVDSAWRFAQRHMIVDHIGDVREHLAFDISAYQAKPAGVSDDRRLLIVFHSRSGATQALADAVIAGASAAEIDGVEVRVRRAFDATVDDVRWAEALLLGTPENFGYMSGALKDFFERIFYVLLEETQGLPYALFVKGGHDGEGAITSVERIVAGLKWKAVQPPTLIVGDLDDAALERCHELGMTIAASLEAGLY